MSLEILHDERVRSIEWRDLAQVTWLETTKELTLSLPWLAASLLLAHERFYLPALLCSFFF
jgi:hypothetical protein